MHKSLDFQLEDIIRSFDFGRVHRVMKDMNWRWATTEDGGVPTIQELQDTARSLMFGATWDYESKPNQPWTFRATGGLKALVLCSDEGPFLELSFEVESKHSYS